MNQEQSILVRLERGETVTPLDALRDCGSFRLAARIEALRKQGYPIETTRVDLPGGKMCAGYKLKRRIEPDGQYIFA